MIRCIWPKSQSSTQERSSSSSNWIRDLQTIVMGGILQAPVPFPCPRQGQSSSRLIWLSATRAHCCQTSYMEMLRSSHCFLSPLGYGNTTLKMHAILHCHAEEQQASPIHMAQGITSIYSGYQAFQAAWTFDYKAGRFSVKNKIK